MTAKRTAAVMALALASGCAGVWQGSDLSGLPTAEQVPGALSIVLLDEMTVVFRAGSGGKPVAEVTEHVRRRILRPGGEDAGMVRVHYSRQLHRLVEFRVRTVSPEGKVRQIDREPGAPFLDYPEHAGQVFYSDSRVAQMEAQPTTPGSVVEYITTLRYDEPRLFQFSQRFGGLSPAKVVSLEVRAPADWTIEQMATRLGAPIDFAPEVRSDGGERVLRWVRRDLPAQIGRPLSPSPFASVPRVTVRLQGWREGGAEVHGPRDPAELSASLVDFMKPATLHDDSLEAQARALVKDLPDDPEARARHLYGWVRDNVSYCAIEIGLGGWRPHEAAEVSSLRYGDCKDKANLLRALLAHAGITSRLVSIGAHDGMPWPFLFPVLAGNFNHVVLEIDLPSGSVMVDPTSQTAPFGRLPASDQEAPCLPIRSPGSALLRAPASTDEDNARLLELELTLLRDGRATGGYHLSARGSDADSLRAVLLHSPAGVRAREVMEFTALPHAEWSAVELVREKPTVEPSPIEARGDLKLGALVAATGRSRLLRYAEIAPHVLPPLDDHPNDLPVVYRVRRRVTDRWRIHLPAGLRASAMPEPVTIDNPLLRYQLRFWTEGRDLLAERQLALREHLVPPERVAELRRYVDEVHAAEARAVVLTEETP